MKSKSLFGAAVVAMTAAALAGCAAPGPAASAGPIDTSGELSGTIQFQTWSLKNEKFTPYFEDLIASFEDEHPEVMVNWIDQPGDGYQDKILSQANSNSLPDVVNLPPNIAFPLAQADKLVDLAAADPSLSQTFVPGAWDAYSFDGVEGTFGLPWYLGADLNWWNATALEQYGVDTSTLPSTQDELMDLAEKVGEASDGKMPVLGTTPDLVTFSSAGVPITDDQGNYAFNTKEAALILDRYREVYDAGGMAPEALTGDYAGDAAMFQQGKTAFVTAGPSFAGTLATSAPDIYKSVIPTARVTEAPLLIQGVSVSRDSQNKAAALAFASYLTNTENQAEFCKLAVGFLPGTVDGSADTASLTAGVTDPIQLKAFEIVSQEMVTARNFTPNDFTSAIGTQMTQQMALAITGEASSQDALDAMVKYANDNRVTQ